MSMPDGYGSAEGGGRPQGGIPIRFIIAAAIALFGVVSYMLRTEVNPVTGKRQHIAMTKEQEMSLGLEAAPKMAAEMGGEVDSDDERAREVSRIGRKVVDDSDASRSPYADNFHFHLLADPKTVNAFALPGGQIFITVGLYSKLKDEAELAGVLGHETGHVINRHAAQQLAKGQLGQVLAAAVGVGASDDRGHGATAQMAAAMANNMLQLKYGRDDESEADMAGFKYMVEAGYDPTAMLDVMKILKDVSAGNRQPEILSTHPLPESRIEALQDALKSAYPQGIPSNLGRGRSLPGISAARDFGVGGRTRRRSRERFDHSSQFLGELPKTRTPQFQRLDVDLFGERFQVGQGRLSSQSIFEFPLGMKHLVRPLDIARQEPRRDFRRDWADARLIQNAVFREHPMEAGAVAFNLGAVH